MSTKDRVEWFMVGLLLGLVGMFIWGCGNDPAPRIFGEVTEITTVLVDEDENNDTMLPPRTGTDETTEDLEGVEYLAPMAWTLPASCPDADSWQVFIFAPSANFVVRGVPYEPAMDLKDWARVQHLIGITIDLEGLHFGTIIRNMSPGYVPPIFRGGWGQVEGFALGGWVDDHVEVQIPSVLSGNIRIEWYMNGVWCGGG